MEEFIGLTFRPLAVLRGLQRVFFKSGDGVSGSTCVTFQLLHISNAVLQRKVLESANEMILRAMKTFCKRLTERASAHPLEESHGSIADGLLCGGSTATCDTLRRTVSAIEFRRESQNDISSGCVLRIERKRFDYFNQKKLLNDWKSYLEDDREAANFKQLHELPINFPPTYPWSENPDESEVMMKTRAPAWCDRVLMNANAYEVVKRGNPSYSSFGRDVCTGDHKGDVSKKQLGENHLPRILEIPEKKLRKVLVSISSTATPLHQVSHVG
ncbi:hypothetical protein Y032_0039g145 [Ancylostoma ceylanicum]|uniref:inositol-polyphosphate 5-phosphatase n=1 Tax=Ancylostoma ceylanicum TaxID=53326 RepID=A0A016UJN0_9BILA|nr:hypothetical protein Y032_0039g145 [Ancylostoma ceylanicum]